MSDNPLEWLAFRYLANEMSDEERAAFEARLEIDPAACEQVAQMVDWTAAITRCEEERPVLAPSMDRSPSRRRISFVFATAATLLVGIALWTAARFEPALPSSSDATTLATSSESALSDVAIEWAAAREEAPADGNDLHFLPDWLLVEEIDEEISARDCDSDLPSWILTAAEVY